MILSTISQFSYNHDISVDSLSTYQLDKDELMFIDLINSFHHRKNDENLPTIIYHYEQLFNKINTTRLVVLKILKYQPNIQPFKIDNKRLQSVATSANITINIIEKPINLTDTSIQTQLDMVEIEPMLKFLSGNMD